MVDKVRWLGDPILAASTILSSCVAHYSCHGNKRISKDTSFDLRSQNYENVAPVTNANPSVSLTIAFHVSVVTVF